MSGHEFLPAQGVAAARNLRLYPVYSGVVAFHAWMPVFFLYLSSRVTLAEVLLLEAIYYLAVVMLEVPSGYLSDRFGRRPVLVIAAGALILAYVVFALGASFWALAAAQVLLATGLAFNSGTDTSFHLASLTAAGSAGAYGEREARIESLTFASGAAAALVGGALGAIDLRLAYLAAGVAACVALVAAWRFVAVDEGDAGAPGVRGFAATLRACLGRIGDRTLGWLFAVSVAATVVNHIPYEFYQPYLDQHAFLPWPATATPWVAGLHLAAAQVVASPLARVSLRLSGRLGIVPHLALTVLYQVVLIGLMARFVHPVIAVLLVTRSIPRALQSAPLRAATAPRVPPWLRATYLSMQSLAGRLAFAVVLLALSLQASEDIGAALGRSLVLSVGVFLVLIALAVLLRPGGRGSLSGSEP